MKQPWSRIAVEPERPLTHLDITVLYSILTERPGMPESRLHVDTDVTGLPAGKETGALHPSAEETQDNAR